MKKHRKYFFTALFADSEEKDLILSFLKNEENQIVGEDYVWGCLTRRNINLLKQQGIWLTVHEDLPDPETRLDSMVIGLLGSELFAWQATLASHEARLGRLIDRSKFLYEVSLPKDNIEAVLALPFVYFLGWLKVN